MFKQFRTRQFAIASILFVFVLTVGLSNLNEVSASQSNETVTSSALISDEPVIETNSQGAEFCDPSLFQDVSGYSQANYPDPVLNVTCDGDNMVVQSNGIPTFEFVQITPNDLQAQNYTWIIPTTPVEASQPSDIPLLGAIGITVTGLPLFGPNEAPRDDYGDPYLDGILDYCSGHTAQQGMYHFHARPDCLFTNIDGNPWLVIGYAFDGYPIMAPYACTDASCSEIYKVDSSWQRIEDVRNAWEAHEYVAGSGDLDECNGMVGSDGQYRYYATDTFPYFLGCYHGVAETSNMMGGGNGGGQQAGQAGVNDNGAPADNGGPANGGPGNGAPPQGGRGNGGPPRRN